MIQKSKQNIMQRFFLLNLLLIAVVILSMLWFGGSEMELSVMLLPILFILPTLLVISNKKTLVFVASSVAFFIFFVGFLGMSLRLIKVLLPYPRIDETRAIGYEHYFNYPLNFDALVIYSVLAFPFIAVVISRAILGKKNDSK